MIFEALTLLCYAILLICVYAITSLFNDLAHCQRRIVSHLEDININLRQMNMKALDMRTNN